MPADSSDAATPGPVDEQALTAAQFPVRPGRQTLQGRHLPTSINSAAAFLKLSNLDGLDQEPGIMVLVCQHFYQRYNNLLHYS